MGPLQLALQLALVSFLRSMVQAFQHFDFTKYTNLGDLLVPGCARVNMDPKIQKWGFYCSLPSGKWGF
jgi:hypothetical protein